MTDLQDSDPYIEAVQQPNVSVHFTGMQRLTENGVVGMDGIERQVDTVICATGHIYLRVSRVVPALTTLLGFDVSFRPVFPVIGGMVSTWPQSGRRYPNAIWVSPYLASRTWRPLSVRHGQSRTGLVWDLWMRLATTPSR